MQEYRGIRRFKSMSKIWKLPRNAALAAALGGGLALLGAGAAMALSVLLGPGASLAVPSTTAATEPDLAGSVIHDALVPFTIKAPAGGALCRGHLQDRVVRSTKTHRLDFYYRIRDTLGTGAVVGFQTARFGGLALRVAYRTDGLGTVPPRVASRSTGAGALVTFRLTDPPVSCAKRQESRFILIKTPATTFKAGGATRIFATTGASVTVPTVMP
jgi:hypothetical protein